MRYYIEILGDKVVSTRLERMGQRAIHARPAMREVAVLVMSIMEKTFSSQGRRGGGSWKQDSDEWLARKLREGLDPRILHAKQALSRSMSKPGAAHQILHIGDTRMILSTDLPYAEKQNIDRPFNVLLPQDRYAIRRIIRNHLTAAMRARV